jgi:hypothetical protein
MTFYTGGSEAMRITTDRNVGIGTVSPATALYVYRTSSDSVGTFQGLQTESGGTGKSAIQLDVNGKGGFAISNDASSGTRALTFSNNSGYGVSTVEAMRITSGGNLLVGTQSSWSSVVKVQIDGGSGTSMSCTTDSNGNIDHIYFRTPSGIAGLIRTNTLTTTYSTSSDYRLKENVAPMTGALDKVAQLKPVTYKWKANGSDGQGFIAHELQEVVPDCVTGTKDAVDAEGNPQYQGVDTSFLVATLVKAIQELKAEVDALKGAA